MLVDEKAAAGDAYGNLLIEMLLLPDPIGLDRLQLWVGEQKTGQIVFCVNLAREAFKSLLMPMKRRSAFKSHVGYGKGTDLQGTAGGGII